MDQREAFVRAQLQGHASMAELCREFGISRKTGYKWTQRFLDGGLPNLLDRASLPRRVPHATDPEVVERIVAVRKRFQGWGPKKIETFLEREHPELSCPARSTIASILSRHGLVEEKRPRRRTPQSTFPLAAATAPNVVWCTDFKGKFRVDRRYCHPLTITDACSRFVLCTEPLECERISTSKAVFETVFREYGLPLRMRSDNGVPFASTGVGGLSKLSVWWVKLGILPERIEPGHPEQNGRHERMHRTLKSDTASPPASDWEAQRTALERWRQEFNVIRPHEALDMRTPASCYQPSPRPYPTELADPEYPEHFDIRRVSSNGTLAFLGTYVIVGTTLQHEHIGLEPIDDGLWHLWFGPVFLGRLRHLAKNKAQFVKETPS